MFDSKSISLLTEAVKHLESGFSELPDINQEPDLEGLRKTLLSVAETMRDNYPYFHPLYAGQMMKPPHPVARLAYTLALWINPNNHALDAGRASSQLEKDAVASIAEMFGWDKYLGHLTGGGTMANLEALWVAGRLNPGKLIVTSEQAHYTHGRISEILGLEFKPVPCDQKARMDLKALKQILETENVGTVVITVGTTGTGSIDPLVETLELQSQYGFRIHIDSAYGGYFTLADNLSPHGRRVYDALKSVDSIVIDPHKHGLQPYGCGCVLFRDPAIGRFYKHDSPYTYFSSSDLHLGEISLECSRAGASAVALWATQQLLPLTREGQFASDLSKSRSAALDLHQRVQEDPRFVPLMEPDTDIVVWAPKAESASRVSQLSRRIFEKTAEKNLHLAVFSYPAKKMKAVLKEMEIDQESVACLRSCLMKPQHKEWMDRIWELLNQSMQEID